MAMPIYNVPSVIPTPGGGLLFPPCKKTHRCRPRDDDAAHHSKCRQEEEESSSPPVVGGLAHRGTQERGHDGNTVDQPCRVAGTTDNG